MARARGVVPAAAVAIPWGNGDWRKRFLAQIANFEYKENYTDPNPGVLPYPTEKNVDDGDPTRPYPLEPLTHPQWLKRLKTRGMADNALYQMYPDGDPGDRGNISAALENLLDQIPEDLWKHATDAISQHFEKHKEELRAASAVPSTTDPKVPCW